MPGVETTPEYATLTPTVQKYEPKQALEAGSEGLDVIQRLVPAAAKQLSTGGWLIFEISPMIVESAVRVVEAAGFFEAPEVIKDLSHQPRVIAGKRKA